MAQLPYGKRDELGLLLEIGGGGGGGGGGGPRRRKPKQEKPIQPEETDVRPEEEVAVAKKRRTRGANRERRVNQGKPGQEGP